MIEKVLDSETVYFCSKCFPDVKGILLIFELEGICWPGILFEKIHMYDLVVQKVRAMSETNNDF